MASLENGRVFSLVSFLLCKNAGRHDLYQIGGQDVIGKSHHYALTLDADRTGSLHYSHNCDRVKSTGGATQ